MEVLSSETICFLEANKNKKIVFTNGCFDILHLGHVDYLNEAKSCGDVLIIGLNSDASVRRLKGENRPINNEDDRMRMLLNLKSVDHVQIFEDDTPYELINLISPQVLVKGGDWKIEQIIGHDLVLKRGGIVKSLVFKDGYSTTKIIESVQGKK